MLWENFLTALFRTALWGGILLLLLRAGGRWAGAPLEIRLAPALIVLTILAVGVSLLHAWKRRVSPEDAAGMLDASGNSLDRYSTALELRGKTALSGMESLALRECDAFFQNQDPQHLRLFRREWLVLLVPAVSLFLLHLYPGEGSVHREVVRDSALQEKSSVALEQMSAELEARGEEWQKLAAELRAGAERLTSEETGDARRAALKELSTLQEKLEAMLRREKSGVSAEDLAKIAEALRSREDGGNAADLLEKGRLAEASRHLEEILERLRKQGKTDRVLEELADSIAQMAKGLAAEQLQQLQQQMAEAMEAAQQGGRAAQMQAAMERLAQALQESGQFSQYSKSGGGSARAMTLQEVLDALERLKEGVRSGDPGEAGQFGFAPSGMESREGQNSGGQSGEGTKDGNPGGVPGTNPDSATAALGEGGASQDQELQAGLAQKISGNAGDGETMREMLRAAGGRSAAARGYKEIYEAAAPVDVREVGGASPSGDTMEGEADKRAATHC